MAYQDPITAIPQATRNAYTGTTPSVAPTAPTGTGTMGNPDPITAINSSALGTGGNINVPPPPTNTNPNPAIAGGTAMTAANNASLGLNSSSGSLSLDSLLAQLNNKPASASDQYATDYAASGIDQKQNQYNTDEQAALDAASRLQGINAQIAGITAQGQAAALDVQGQPALGSFQDAQTAEISRQAAIRALPLQAQALATQAEVAAAQGKAGLSQQILQQAQQHLDTVFQLHQTDSTNQYKYKTDLINSVYQYATKQEQAQLDSQKTAQQQAFTQQQNQLNYAQSLSTAAIANGAPKVAAQIAALNPQSPTYSQDVATLAAQIPQKQNLQYVSGTVNQPAGIFNQNTGKFISLGSGGGGGNGGGATYNGEFAATIDLAAQAGSTNAQRSQIKENLQSFIANKDYQSAYTQVLASASAKLTGANASNFQQQEQSYSALSDMSTALKELKATGYDTNLLTGGVNKIQTKIGALLTDPRYAAVATRLDSAFQQYRQNMTGAAFGVKESSEYASVLPSAGNTFALNMAKIDGAQQYLNSVIESTIKNTVGQGGIYIKQYAEGAGKTATSPTAPLSTGATGTLSSGLTWTIK